MSRATGIDHNSADGILLSRKKSFRRPASSSGMRRTLARQFVGLIAQHPTDLGDWVIRPTLASGSGQTTKPLTEIVKNWWAQWPEVLPLPHPSPRNNHWLKQNPWFKAEVLPALRAIVSELILPEG